MTTANDQPAPTAPTTIKTSSVQVSRYRNGYTYFLVSGSLPVAWYEYELQVGQQVVFTDGVESVTMQIDAALAPTPDFWRYPAGTSYAIVSLPLSPDAKAGDDPTIRGYIATRVDRINRATSDRVKLDCLWQIASEANLYPAWQLERMTEGRMTPSVRAEVIGWLQAAGFTVSL